MLIILVIMVSIEVSSRETEGVGSEVRGFDEEVLEVSSNTSISAMVSSTYAS